MAKTIKKILIIAALPFALYYGALAYTIVSWGNAESRVEQTCINYYVLKGETQDYAKSQC